MTIAAENPTPVNDSVTDPILPGEPLVLFNRLCPDQPATRTPVGLNIASLRFDYRQRSRLRMTIDAGPLAGTSAGIDLPRGTVLRDNALLMSANDELLLVRAAPEELIEVHAPDAVSLTRLAYHLGNRHVPLQVVGNTLRLQPDHVLARMIAGLGGKVTNVSGPFDPESGAYATNHTGATSDRHHDGPTAPHRYAHDHPHTPGGHSGHSRYSDRGHAPRIHDLSEGE